MRKRFIGWACVVTAMLFAPGCLVKDVTQTVYLEPGGTVTWAVLEKDVRSDGDTADDRAREEAEYADAVAIGQHPVALAFSQLRPTDLRTTILRAERPYTVLTEARFTSLDQVMRLFTSKLGARATSTLERHNGLVTWTLTVYPGSMESDENETVAPLIDFFDRGRFVLASGQFRGAVGLDLSEDRHVATIHMPEDVSGEGASTTEPLRLLLEWGFDQEPAI
jgi:hypothetical protein